MKFFTTYIAWILLGALFCFRAGAQSRDHIPGLENHAEYRRLVEEEAMLTRKSDSVTVVMNDLRNSLRTDSLNRTANSAAILRMEEEMFDMRNRIAKLVGQINTIEQEWILRNLDSDPLPDEKPDPSRTENGEEISGNLVYSRYFGSNLGPDDLRELHGAQEMEQWVPPLVIGYRENIGRLRTLKNDYDLSVTQVSADSIKMRFDSLSRVNSGIEREIAEVWGTVFDSKSYVYNLLMDKAHRNDLLQQYENDMELLRQQQAEWNGVYASDEIVNYVLQKQLLTRYEILFAGELSNGPALDSLKRVQGSLPRVDMLDIAPVVLSERLFLDYEDITVNSSSPYNSRNPIPEVKVYPKGIIYRVLLGTYSSAQQPSVFRNVSPLAVQKGPDNKYRYFAGGFPTDSTVNAAVEKMRQRGFRNPEAVVWMDGVYINQSTGEGLGSGFYRVELSGVHELSPEVREVIRTVTGGKDIVRGGNMFIVGPLDDPLEAVRLRSALEGRDHGMDVNISEIE